MTQKELVIKAAKTQLGYKEKPNNDTIYGKWWGLNHQPWCAMFVSWCFAQANAVHLIEAQGSKGFAGCEAMESWAKKKKLIVKTSKVQAGDILLYDFNKAGKAVHTGIAIGGINPNTHLIDAIEGNTSGDNLGSQANGDGVFLKHRSITTIRAVIRPNWSN